MNLYENAYEIAYGRMDAFLPTEEEFLPITDEYYQKSQFQKAVENLKEGRSGVIFFSTPYHQTCSDDDTGLYLAEFRQEGAELILWVLSGKPTKETEFFRNLGFHAFSELQNSTKPESLRITTMSSFYRNDPNGMDEKVYRENIVPSSEFLKKTSV